MIRTQDLPLAAVVVVVAAAAGTWSCDSKMDTSNHTQILREKESGHLTCIFSHKDPIQDWFRRVTIGHFDLLFGHKVMQSWQILAVQSFEGWYLELSLQYNIDFP